jgi:Zn finger protein HypA/HybF involved in hydrogenase expression
MFEIVFDGPNVPPLKKKKVLYEKEVTKLYWKECLKMKWHCIQCRAYFDEVQELLKCPYCNSEMVERVSDGKRSWR